MFVILADRQAKPKAKPKRSVKPKPKPVKKNVRPALQPSPAPAPEPAPKSEATNEIVEHDEESYPVYSYEVLKVRNGNYSTVIATSSMLGCGVCSC